MDIRLLERPAVDEYFTVFDPDHVAAHTDHAFHKHHGWISGIAKSDDVLPVHAAQGRNAERRVRKPRPVEQLVQEHMIADHDGLFHRARGNHRRFCDESPDAEHAQQNHQQRTNGLPCTFAAPGSWPPDSRLPAQAKRTRQVPKRAALPQALPQLASQAVPYLSVPVSNRNQRLLNGGGITPCVARQAKSSLRIANRSAQTLERLIT